MKNFPGRATAVGKWVEDVEILQLWELLACGFWGPATTRWKGIRTVVEWFAFMNYPFPLVSAYRAAPKELLGVFLLALGLATGVIPVQLIFVVAVAILTVHLPSGFSAATISVKCRFTTFLCCLCSLCGGQAV